MKQTDKMRDFIAYHVHQLLLGSIEFRQHYQIRYINEMLQAIAEKDSLCEQFEFVKEYSADILCELDGYHRELYLTSRELNPPLI